MITAAKKIEEVFATRLKRIRHRKPIIENFVFKLHYRMTVTMLIAFVILFCTHEYFGAHISCMADNGIDKNVIENYCFFMATFTIVRHYNESLLEGGFLPHPGLGPMSESDETLHHTYYQWVPFVLFIQAICFYVPHYIWKKKEGGRIHALVQGLQYTSLALEEYEIKLKRDIIIPSKKTIDQQIEWIRNDIVLRLKITQTWSVWLVSMEVLNFLHVMLQIWINNMLLDGKFIGLGPIVLNYRDWEHRIADPLETVFPKVTKCVFHKFGPSGSLQQHDALCVMTLNIIYEKIYSVLWFWLLFLFIASFLAIVWRAITFFTYRRSLRFNEVAFQHANFKYKPMEVIKFVNGFKFGDWLFLYYLAKNMEGIVLRQLLVAVKEELDKANASPSNGVTAQNPIADSTQVNVDVHNDDEIEPFIE